MIKYKFKQYGNELRFNYCPICGKEKDNPDFTINIKTQKYFCHTTGQGGTLEQLEKDYNFDLNNIEEIDTQELEEGETKPTKNFKDLFINSQKDFNNEWLEYLKNRGITNIDNINKLFRRGKNNSMMIPLIEETGKIIGIKYRTINKKLSSESGSSSNYFLNWHNVEGTNYIVIVEGEIDLLSALETGHKNIISLPFGANNIKCVKHQKEWLSKFEKIIIATDNDAPGRESKEKIIKELKNISHKLYDVDLGKYKDFNEILQAEGKEKLNEIMESHKKIKVVSPLPMFYGERGKFLFDVFSNHLVKKHNIINIENELYIYNGKVYQKDKQLEKIMIDEIKDLSFKNRSETLKYIYLIAPEKERDDKGLIAFNNGIYSIEKNKLYPFNSEYILTNLVPWDFKEGVYSELMDNTLNKLAYNNKDIRTLIDEVIGYILFSKNQLGKAFIIVGDRANGKSTFLNCMKFMIGIENTSYLSLTDITNSRFRVIETKDKLLNIGDDIGSGYIPESENLKKLITGDPMTAEKKGKDPIKFNCYAKFLFSANEIPQIKDPTGAMARRLIIIPFLNTFTKENGDYDPYFIDKLKSRECMEYLIYIGIEGLKRVLKNKGFSETEETKQLLKEFNENNNPIFEFVEYLENDSPNPMTFDYIINHFSTQEIFEGKGYILSDKNSSDYLVGYRTWAKNNGFNPLSFVNFKKSMQTNFNLEIKRREKNGSKKRYFIK